MKPVTLEWVEKAEKDLTSAKRELRLRKAANLDLACFLAQQAVEKLLKARLQEASVRIEHTHDLARLIDLLAPVEPLWKAYRAALQSLSAYAVIFRYPGRTATREMAKSAVDHALAMRTVVRESLGLLETSRNRRTPPRSGRIKTKRKKKP